MQTESGTSQIVSDNVLCIACGADVRRDALFCYSCGAAVVAPEDTTAADAALQSTSAAIDIPNDTQLEPQLPQPAAREARRPLTPAMLRRKKAFNRRQLEIEWRPPENESSFFPIVAAMLVGFTVLVLIAAMYLR